MGIGSSLSSSAKCYENGQHVLEGWVVWTTDHFPAWSQVPPSPPPSLITKHRFFGIIFVPSTHTSSYYSYFLNVSPFWYWCTDTVWYVLVLRVASTTKLHRRNNWRGNCPFIYSEDATEIKAPWEQTSCMPCIEQAFKKYRHVEFRMFSVIETHLSCVCVSCSVVSDSLQPQRLQSARFLCPWNSPGKNIGMGCHFLLLLVLW